MKKTNLFAFTAMCILSITSCQSDFEISSGDNNLEQVKTTNQSKDFNHNFFYKIERVNEKIITDYENGIDIQNNSYLQNIQISYDISEHLLTTGEVNALRAEQSVVEEIGIQNYLSNHNYSQYFKDRINDFLNYEDITHIDSSADFQILSQDEKTRLTSLIILQKDFFEYYGNPSIVAKGIPPEDKASLLATAIAFAACYPSTPGGISLGYIFANTFYNVVLKSMEAIYPWTFIVN